MSDFDIDILRLRPIASAFYETLFDSNVNKAISFEYLFFHTKALYVAYRSYTCTCEFSHDEFVTLLPGLLFSAVAADRALPENKRCGVEDFLTETLAALQHNIWTSAICMTGHTTALDSLSSETYSAAYYTLCRDAYLCYAIRDALHPGMHEEDLLTYIKHHDTFSPLVSLRYCGSSLSESTLRRVCDAWYLAGAAADFIEDFLPSFPSASMTTLVNLRQLADWAVDPFNYRRIFHDDEAPCSLGSLIHAINTSHGRRLLRAFGYSRDTPKFSHSTKAKKAHKAKRTRKAHSAR